MRKASENQIGDFHSAMYMTIIAQFPVTNYGFTVCPVRKGYWNIEKGCKIV
jgi:hypothetical protein